MRTIALLSVAMLALFMWVLPRPTSKTITIRANKETIAYIIEQESRKAGIDPILTTAIIMQESSGNPLAKNFERSLAGKFKDKALITATGLMQVVPAYHMKTCGLKNVKELENPATNIKCGLKHLKSCFNKQASNSKTKRFQGAIACYNAGSKPSPTYVKSVEKILRKIQGIA